MKMLIANQKTIISIALILMSFCFLIETTYGEVSISEIMYGSEIRFSPKQWIEISNSGTETIDLTGWTLTIQNVDSDDLLGPVTATINFRDATFEDAPRIWPNDFLLIVTSETDDNSGDFMEDQVYDLRWREDLGISFSTTWLSTEGFRITLKDKDGDVVDEAGNYDGTQTLWDLPYNFNRGRIRAGNRTSLIRRYANGVALNGTLRESWVSAADANLTADQKTYYGDENDISSPGTGIIDLNSPAPANTQETYSEVSISEIMYGSEIRFSPKQWIEISNSGTGTVNLTGWTLTIQNVDSDDLLGPVTATINFRDATFEDAPRIWPNDFLLIVTSETDDNSGDFMEDQVYDLRWREDLGISFSTTWLSTEGFRITLKDKDGDVVDEVGNYDGTQMLWNLPYDFNRGRTRAENRTSLIRRYANGVALDGTLETSWVSAADANLPKDQQTYYGDENDISSPGILNALSSVGNTGGTPPVITQQTPTSDAIVRLLPATVAAPAVGDKLTFSLNIEGGTSVAGYEATLQFNETAFRYIESGNSDYLPDGAFFAPPIVAGNRVTLSAASLAGAASGNGTLATITFEVIAEDTFTLTLSNVSLSDNEGKLSVPKVENAEISKTGATGLKGDVNGDGTVNISDLVLVAANLGKTGQNAADVNADGVVNISDLVLVAGALGTTAAAPSLHPQALEMLTATEVKQWLTQAQQLNLTDTMSVKGIRFLEQLLTTLMPKETALLANYPNPFNPETWIPYQLAKDADVTLHIYAVNGTLVRTLVLGHQSAGIYQNRSRAAYWDGKNAVGEKVASGVYFYTLTAGDFTATRKMLIRK